MPFGPFARESPPDFYWELKSNACTPPELVLYVRLPCDDFTQPSSSPCCLNGGISLKAERLTDRIAFTSESNELLTALTSNYSPNEVRLRSLPLSKADRYPIGFEKGKKVTRREGTEWLPTACRVFFPDLLVWNNFPTERNSRSKINSILLIKILLILLLNIEYRIEYSIQRKPPLPPIKIKIFLLAHFFLFNRSLLAFLYERPTELTKNLNGLVWASRLSISIWTDASSGFVDDSKPPFVVPLYSYSNDRRNTNQIWQDRLGTVVSKRGQPFSAKWYNIPRI